MVSAAPSVARILPGPLRGREPSLGCWLGALLGADGMGG